MPKNISEERFCVILVSVIAVLLTLWGFSCSLKKYPPIKRIDTPRVHFIIPDRSQ